MTENTEDLSLYDKLRLERNRQELERMDRERRRELEGEEEDE
jgi:hypothetical protein